MGLYVPSLSLKKSYVYVGDYIDIKYMLDCIITKYIHKYEPLRFH